MDKRVIGAIIIVIGLSLVGGIVYFTFFYDFSKPAEAVTPAPVVQPEKQTVSENLPAKINEPATEPVSPLKKSEVKQDDLLRMASAFAERFGSFSNQSDYGNIRDLQIFMTDSMKSWAQDYIESARLKKVDTTIYYGIITKAISGEVKQFDSEAGQAEILVKTQRRESAGVTSNSATFYQDIIIKYLRENGVWRVNGVFWQAR